MSRRATAARHDGSLDTGPLVGSLSFALRRAQAAVTDDFADRFAAEQIRPAQFALLAVLGSNPGVRQSQLSEALGLQRTNLVPLLDELEERGLLARRRVENDRRAAAIELTQAGTALLARLRALAEQHEDRFTQRLGGPEQRGTLLHLLGRLAADGTPGPAAEG